MLEEEQSELGEDCAAHTNRCAFSHLELKFPGEVKGDKLETRLGVRRQLEANSVRLSELQHLRLELNTVNDRF